MKKLLFFASVLSAFALVAGEDAASVENVYGVLRIDSTNAETIVAVPWVGVGGNAIPVADLVKTAGLHANDELYAYVGDGFQAWHLVANPTTEVLEWAPMTIVSGDGKPAVSSSAPITTLERGQAILLRRYGELANCFYIFGQVGANATAEVQVAAGTVGTPAYTLLAPPAVADADLNSLITYKNGVTPNANDEIWVQTASGSAGHYSYKNGIWGHPGMDESGPFPKPTSEHVSGPAITAGNGIWYVSRGGSPTIQWQSVPSVQ